MLNRIVSIPILLTLVVFVPHVQSSDIVWLEAEQFNHFGGWKNDPQFIDQMGSPFLLAVGLGQPTDDAKTVISLAQSQQYRLWVRTRDWVAQYHSGRFQILLNGKVVAHPFGADGNNVWHWEDGGVHLLPGSLEVRLHDLTGYYARCDTIVFSRDLQWRPPESADQLAALRALHGGVSRIVTDMPRHDVVVVGGGLAGCTAAVAAARNGADVVLIQNRPVLGGNASTEILVPPVGAWPGVYHARFPLDPRETGIMEEYRTPGNQRVVEGKLYSSRLLRWVQLEPNLDLHLNTHATGVEMLPADRRKIAAVLAVDTHSGHRYRFPGKIFIDCTGDAVVGVAAGAEYRHGKESKAMYGEPWAPDEATPHTMGNGLKYYAREFDTPQPFVSPPWAYHFPTCDSFGPGRHPNLTTTSAIGYQWNIELGGMRDTYKDAEQIRDDLLRLIYGLWDHTKNHCARDSKRALNYRLAWVGYIAGKRENRRLLGDYVLTQNDIGAQTLFPDRVAFGAWSVDDHYSEGFFYKGATGQHFDRTQYHYKGWPFAIPFRCLYSRNINNLMMAGRDISASHLGLSDTRVMLTCATLGHATGTAAALCLDAGVMPRKLQQTRIGQLQQRLLKEGATIFDLQANDPQDLASEARVTASSYRTHVSGDVMLPENVTNGYARAVGQRDQETTNAWAADPTAKPPHWVELDWPDPVSFNVIHVVFQTAELAPRSITVEALQMGTWKPVATVTKNRFRRLVLGIDPIKTSGLRLVLLEPAAVCELRVYQESARAVQIARRALRNMFLPDQGPFLPWGEDSSRQTQINASDLAGIVIDDSELEAIGMWEHSTWSGQYVGEGYLTDGNLLKGKKQLRTRLHLPTSGLYEVRLGYSAYKNRADNTLVTICTRTGKKTLRVNQRVALPDNAMFASLGTFDFDPSSAEITISNDGTNGYVVVDAIQLIPKK